jgi:hypothetical protein
MKIAKMLLLACFLTSGLAFADTSATDADKKWLQAVEKMVTDGKMKVSTPSETRVNLLKEWAGKNGYTANSARTGTSYKVELSKSVVKN